MIGVLAEAQLFLIAGVAFAWSIACVVGVAIGVGRGRLAHVEPVARTRALSALAAAPIVLALAGMIACALPSAIGFATHAGDHCDHHDGHPHLCPWHLPAHGSTLGWLLLGAVGLWIAVRVGEHCVDLARGAALVSALRRNAASDPDVVVLESDAVFAATVGLFAPTVVVTRGLRERLEPDEVRAALAHERAHARRRDALRLAVVRTLWSPMPSAVAQPLLFELALACEEVCDREAAGVVGDPLVVADAIVRASRAVRGREVPQMAGAVGFGAHAIDRRVRRLLHPARARSSIGVTSLAIMAVLVLTLAEPIHHATETFLGLLLH